MLLKTCLDDLNIHVDEAKDSEELFHVVRDEYIHQRQEAEELDDISQTPEEAREQDNARENSEINCDALIRGSGEDSSGGMDDSKFELGIVLEEGEGSGNPGGDQGVIDIILELEMSQDFQLEKLGEVTPEVLVNEETACQAREEGSHRRRVDDDGERY